MRPAATKRSSGYGIELHGRVELGAYQIHRLLRHDRTVTRTTLLVGGPPTTQVETFRTRSKAVDFTDAQLDHRRTLLGLRISFETDLALRSGDDADRAFTEAWDQDIFDMLGAKSGAPRTHWVLFRNLDQATAYDHGMATIRTYIADHAHHTNRSTIQTVGLANHLPQIAGPDYAQPLHVTYSGVSVFLLGDRAPACAHGTPACMGCETRLAELIEYLARGQSLMSMDAPARAHLVATAHRLVAARTLVSARP